MIQICSRHLIILWRFNISTIVISFDTLSNSSSETGSKLSDVTHLESDGIRIWIQIYTIHPCKPEIWGFGGCKVMKMSGIDTIFFTPKSAIWHPYFNYKSIKSIFNFRAFRTCVPASWKTDIPGSGISDPKIESCLWKHPIARIWRQWSPR